MGDHSLPVSFFSTVYPIIGLPPSDFGGVHDTVMEVAWMSATSGVPGAPGTSGETKSRGRDGTKTD